MKIITIISFCFLIGSNLSAQCSFGRISKKILSHSNTTEAAPKPDKTTSPRELFSKLDFATVYSFAKSGEDYYLFIMAQRAQSKTFELRTNNSLTLKSENNKSITLKPCCNFTGKRFIGRYGTGGYYPISKEEIAFLVKHQIASVVLEVSSENPITGGMNIENGMWKRAGDKRYAFTTGIRSKNKRKKIQRVATCFYQSLD